MKTSRPIYILVAILMLGLALRLVFFNQFMSTLFYGHPLLDAQYYDDMGQRVASGMMIQDMAFFMGPLYPYLIGLLYAITGHNPDIYRIAQMVLGLGSCVLIFFIGRRVFSETVGLLAALIYAAYKPVLFHEQTLLMETTLGFFFLAFFLLLLKKRDKAHPAWWMAIGAALGVAGLFRGNVLLFFPFLAGWMAWTAWPKKRETILKIAFLTAGLILSIMPATIHNYLAERDFVPITSNDGINLYIGNNENASGCFEPPPLTDVNMVVDPRGSRFAEETLGRSPLKSSAIAHFWRLRAFAWMKKYPFDFLKLTVLKFYYLWGSVELDQIYSTKGMSTLMPAMRWPLANFFILGPLSLIGLFLALRKPEDEKVLLALGIAAYLLSLVPFFITDRYRIPAIPLLCLFAGHALVHCYEIAKSRRWKECGRMGAMLLVLFFVLDNKNHPARRQEKESFHNSLGLIYQAEGRQDEAIREFKTALSFGEVPQLYSNLGNSCFMKKDYLAALEYYKKVAVLDPKNPLHYFRLGQSCYNLDRFDEARHYYEIFLGMDPRSIPVAWMNLAWIYNQKGQREKARESMRAYLELRPNDQQAREIYRTQLGGR